MTVAVVDAFDLPTAEADLAVYRTQFGLPACTTANGCFRKVNQSGATSPLPVYNAGWAGEIALDMDMVSATCPNCKILLVEATTNSFFNLATSVNTAVSLGAIAVSNSYGAAEFSGQTSYDSYYNHPGVAITVSTADCGYGCSGMVIGDSWPSASPNVVAVGGTSLVHNTSARGWTESAWGVVGKWGAGSGCSLYEPKPSWQHDTGCANRTQADVSAVADPATGVAIYSVDPSVAGWGVYGGTSASSPIIAAVFALAGHLAAGTYPASYLYADTADLYDVTSGSNDIWEPTAPAGPLTIVCTVTYLCNGVTGYDGPTGLGTPNGVHAFIGPPTVPGKPTNLVAVAGNTTVGLTWTAPADNGGSAITLYTVTSSSGSKTCTWTSGPLSCTVSGLTNGTPYTFSVTATNGVGTGPASDASNSVTPAAGLGLLRVTTNPALPAQISLNGVPVDSWGLNWLELPPGNYAVSFSHVEGYTEPAPAQVSVTAGQTTTLAGNFTARGSLRVITSPALPGQISVDTVPRDDWGMWTDLAVGSHQVCFGPVSGFDAPTCQTVNVTAGALTTVTGAYTADAAATGSSGLGLLRVTTNPALPAQISLNGVPVDSWGLNWLELAPGSYTVSFSHVEGYTEPAPAQVSVTAGQTTTLAGNFTARGSLRVITSPALPGQISVDTVPRDDWGMWTDLAVGSHQVCFGPVSGFDAPTCQTVNVTAGALTTVTGAYTAHP